VASLAMLALPRGVSRPLVNFRIADTFTDSLGRLTADEQKAAKTTAFDLQVNPASPGLQFHKLDRARDRNFWSVRVGSDIRLIVHRTDGSLLLCYVDHHDRAYQWAERRRLETHPKTGAAQLVEVRETVQEVIVPVYVKQERPAPPKPMLFAEIAAERLLEYGVPVEWLDDVRAATEDSILDLANHLPGEAAEALLCLAVGGKPATRASVPVEMPVSAEVIAPQAFEHPDAQRRFRTVSNIEELERALEFPWEKWTVFLHPAQRETVGRDYSGPARVSGSAGTGKTVVALHRAVFLARANPETRVLLTTFSEILANALRTQLRRLIHKREADPGGGRRLPSGHDPRLAERLEVHAIDAIGLRLFKSHFGAARLASREDITAALKAAAGEVAGHKFSPHFLLTEWEQVVDAWQLDTWKSYRDVRRLGRKTRLPEAQRALLWSIFEKVRARLAAKGVVTLPEVFGKVAAAIGGSRNPPFHFAVIDEAQDMGVPHLRFLAALGGDRPNALFFAGDLGQRIFQQPFSWRALGVDIRGRSRMSKRRPNSLRPKRRGVWGGGFVHRPPSSRGELPDVAPDPDAGRSAARPGRVGCGRQHRGARAHDLGLQRPGPDDPGGRCRCRRSGGGVRLDQRAAREEPRPQRVRHLRALSGPTRPRPRRHEGQRAAVQGARRQRRDDQR
jgi:mRNA-degrading endonuclease RelE of RelBE toxin-antitoxin system